MNRDSLDGRAEIVRLTTAFLLTGAATVTLGPLLPELRRAWQASAGEVAWLFTAQFGASALGSVLSTRRPRLSLLGGYALIGGGLLLLSVSDQTTAILAMAAVGLGLGAALPVTNLLVAFGDPENRAAALARLNLVWSLGAMGFPLVLAALAETVPLRLPVAVLGALCLAAIVPLLSVEIPPEVGGRKHTGPDTRSPEHTRLSLLGLLPFALVFLFYVGTETTFGGWLVSLAEEIETVGPTTAILVGWSFWAALLAGRALTPPALRLVSEHALFSLSLGLAVVGCVLLIAFQTVPAMVLGSCLGGLGLAPLFPLTISSMTRRAQQLNVTDTGWTFVGTGIGGALLPWGAGRITDLFESTRWGFTVPLVGLAAMVILFSFFTGRESR